MDAPHALAGGLRQSTRQPTGLFWSTDSIFNSGVFQTQTAAGLTGSVAPVFHRAATYGGNCLGMSLFHLADETWAYVGGSWQLQTRPEPLQNYAALIVEAGRNDTANIEKTAYTDAWDKAIAQGMKYFPRVVPSMCPPRALADLTGWDPTNDGMVTDGTGGTHQRILDVWAKWGLTSYYDTFANFSALVTAGTYTVAQLMRDIYHPTLTTGATVISAALASKLNTYAPPSSLASPTITGRVINYLYGVPAAGVWTMMSGVNAVGPTISPVAQVTQLTDQFPYAAESGARLTFPATYAKQVWVSWICKGSSGGTFTAYVDRGTAFEKSTTQNTTQSGLPNYPQNMLIGNTELDASLHTIEIETTNASQVAILGVTVLGVP